MQFLKSSWTAWVVAAIASVAAAWFFHSASRQQEEIRGLRKELARAQSTSDTRPMSPPFPSVHPPERESLPPVEAPVLKPVGTTTNDEVAMTTFAADSNAPAQPPEIAPEVAQAMASFDRAMDKEFDRLESREGKSIAEAELKVIDQLKEQMLLLDEVRARADEAQGSDEIAALQTEMQTVMGRIISLGQTHRRQRLEDLALRAGYQTDEDVKDFLAEVDGIYRDTQLDWAALFNRGP